MRSAYRQNRDARLAGTLSGRFRQGQLPARTKVEEDLYYFDDEEDWDESEEEGEAGEAEEPSDGDE